MPHGCYECGEVCDCDPGDLDAAHCLSCDDCADDADDEDEDDEE